MVKHFDPACPKCKKKFHVHHEELRYAGIKLLCPYCQNEFFVDECDSRDRARRHRHEPEAEGPFALGRLINDAAHNRKRQHRGPP